MERSAPPAALGDAHAPPWALSDGLAGNVRQSESLAQALGGGAWRYWTLAPRWPWRACAPLHLPGSAGAFGSDFADALLAPPRLAIGCGRQAALATRVLRARGTSAVQILDPRLDPRHWDIVIAPAHDRLRGSNVLSMVGSLHPVDEAWLAQARADFPAFADLPRPRTAVLLGGPSRHVRFDHAAFGQLAGMLDTALARDGGSVMLTTSRRTPRDVCEALRHRPLDTAGVTWLGPADGSNPYAGLLGWADRIVCSPDSVNMISEACATTVPVHVFEPGRTRGRLRAFLDSLLARGRIRALDGALAPFDVEPLRETARIAQQVRDQLGL